MYAAVHCRFDLTGKDYTYLMDSEAAQEALKKKEETMEPVMVQCYDGKGKPRSIFFTGICTAPLDGRIGYKPVTLVRE